MRTTQTIAGVMISLSPGRQYIAWRTLGKGPTHEVHVADVTQSPDGPVILIVPALDRTRANLIANFINKSCP